MRSRVWILRQNFPISLIHYWATCPVVYFNWVMRKGRTAKRRRIMKEAPFLLGTTTFLCCSLLPLFSFLDGMFYVLAHFFLRPSLPFSYFLPLPPFPQIKPNVGKESDEYASVRDRRSWPSCKLIYGRNTSVHQIFTVRPLQAVVSILPLFPWNLHDT